MELLTFEEVADMFKVDPLTIRSWINRGQLPKWVLWKLPGARNGTTRIIKEKLEEWKQDGCLQAQERKLVLPRQSEAV